MEYLLIVLVLVAIAVVPFYLGVRGHRVRRKEPAGMTGVDQTGHATGAQAPGERAYMEPTPIRRAERPRDEDQRAI